MFQTLSKFDLKGCSDACWFATYSVRFVFVVKNTGFVHLNFAPSLEVYLISLTSNPTIVASVPTFRRLSVVVRLSLLLRVMGRNGETTFRRGPTIWLPPIIYRFML